jgi:hypothetical protein
VSQERKPDKRTWRGIVIGRRVSGSIKASLIRRALRHTKAPLFGVLTICPKCCIELKLHKQFDQMERIHKFEGNHNTLGKMTFRLSYKEMEELFSSKVIVLMERQRRARDSAWANRTP